MDVNISVRGLGERVASVASSPAESAASPRCKREADDAPRTALPSANAPGERQAGVARRDQKRSRRQLTRNACNKCRSAKAKCNGKHPTCDRCWASGCPCIYDVQTEGITKMQNLQQKLDLKTRQLDIKIADYELVMSVVDQLQQGTDEQASEILARLRLGESIKSIAPGLDLSRDEAPLVPALPVMPSQSWSLGPLDASVLREQGFLATSHVSSHQPHVDSVPAFNSYQTLYPDVPESSFASSAGRSSPPDPAIDPRLSQVSSSQVPSIRNDHRRQTTSSNPRKAGLSFPPPQPQSRIRSALVKRPPIYEGVWPATPRARVKFSVRTHATAPQKRQSTY